LQDSLNEKDSPDRYEIMLNILMRAAEGEDSVSELVDRNDSTFDLKFYFSDKEIFDNNAVYISSLKYLFSKA